ncbi:MAG: GIY-YIG nuclease family protein [Alphaproteobacteria bacterium]|nr:GIY-YIG nuclease family protein [Alphaproteobacteria bacterium]
MKDMVVCILTNDRGNVMYVGVTNDLERRVREHQSGLVPGFTKKYNVRKLVYYDLAPDPEAAITREKQIKGWRREKKSALVETLNPRWEDLSA